MIMHKIPQIKCMLIKLLIFLWNFSVNEIDQFSQVLNIGSGITNSSNNLHNLRIKALFRRSPCSQVLPRKRRPQRCWETGQLFYRHPV
ncbi:unnamed protein product [Hymenolepis diminuta]|uniref:Secreted protein n=1 Tax=Hymenolepis diminuta TaxID=6216 RepID=A0A564Z139_HYMDI|nr:unnamed protein product [Hymenolepis diminuta]